ncbi:hypothetical protein [Pseudoalteromonas sp. OOF1S-7]|uniref:PKD domain-containing protein n=1 Tax=Pseudoalteromonas sp. OOF1S-7 TaxID=2917757 RepID=UPI001EF3D792|nr:hypothetical protein [Pseudoalteromonas sp. OOF1S-7]MCG7537085.1 hypothetical protein [Pseudoalteromonas sp. OOF1S-7]
MLKRLPGAGAVSKALFLSVLLLGLSACGGSGGSDDTNSAANSGGGTPKATNVAPSVSIEGTAKAAQLVPITLTANASDSDGRIESYQWSFDPALPVSSEDFNSPSFTLVSKQIEESISFDVKVTVTDNQGKQAVASQIVEILVPDTTPWHLNIDGKDSTQEQSTLRLSLSSDILIGSSAQIFWSHDSSLPLVLTENDSGILSVDIPDISESQVVNFTARVTLSDGRTNEHTHKVTIEAFDNLAPEVKITGEHEAVEGTTSVLIATASDPDGEVVSYAWSHNAETELTITGETTESLSVSSDNIMVDQLVTFTVTVTDNQGLSSSSSKELTFVALPNVAPTARIEGAQSVEEQSELTLTADASDSDGQVARYHWSYASDISLAVSSPDESTFVIKSADITQDHTAIVSLTVYDNQGATTTVEHSLNIVARANTAPEVSIDAVQDAIERQPFTVIASAIDLDGEVVSHAWSHDSSLALTIDGQTSDTLTVVSPDIQSPQNITFTYTATDNQGASASTSAVVTVENVTVAFTVAGKVTDSPIAFAKVTMEIADSTFETQADENGDYTLSIEVDEAHSGVLAKLSAQGVDEQSQVTLVSQLHSVAAINEAAGDDEVVSSDELFDVNVTNVTTAEYALLGRDTQSFSNDNELDQARARISSQEQLMLAAVLKAVIDHGVTLPDTANSTLELASDPELIDELIASIAETQPSLIEQLEQEITGDETLVEAVTFSPNGSYYLVETQYVDGLDYKLTFNPDGTGLLATADTNETFTWTQTGEEISVQLDREIFLTSNQFEHFSGFFSSSFKMTMYDQRQKSLAVRVEFYQSESQVLSGYPVRTYSTAAQLFGTADLTGITESELLGTWGLSYSRQYEQEYVELTFKADGVLEFDIGLGAWAGSWHIEDGQVRVTSSLLNFKLKFIRPFEFGFQTLIESGSVGAQQYRQGTFIKRQPITFNDINYQKTWRKVRSKASHSAFTIDENNNFNFRWHRGIQGSNEEGILKRYRYRLNGRRVDFCNAALVNCEISGVYSYELLAQVGNTIAVVYADEKQNLADQQSEIHFFKLSDKAWPLGQFTQSFFNTDKLERLFGAGTHLYSVTPGSVVYLRSEHYCPTNPSPSRLCFDSIVFKGERYKARIEGARLRLEHINSNAVSYLEITGESEHRISMCHFSEGALCAQGEQHEFGFVRPELEVTISQTGRGQLAFSQEQFFYGDSFYIEIDQREGSVLGSISGCNGVLDDTITYKRYRVDSLIASCVIEVEFIDKTAHIQNTLLVDATPAGLTDSWYYTIDAQGRGTYFGLDGNATFTVQQRNAYVYDFIFDDIIRTRVNGYNYYASKFALWYSSSSSAMSGCWNGSRESADIEPGSEGHGLICTHVELAASQPPAEIAVDELTGDWYLNFDQSLASYQLTLNEDGTGRLNSTDDGAVFNRQVNWQVSAENRLELTDEAGMFAAFSVLRKEDSLYTLIAHETDHGNHASWQAFGTWAMIRTGHQSLGFEQLKGAWHNVDDQDIDGFYLFAGGEYRSGRFNGAASAIIENNVLTVTAGYNSLSGEYDHLCESTQPECETRTIAHYEVIALDGQRAYIRVQSGTGASDTLSAVEIDPAFPIDIELPAYFNSAKFYEKVNGTLRTWQFEQLYQKYFANLSIDGQSEFTVYYENGVFRKYPDEDGFRYRVQEVNVDALVLCPIVAGQCDTQNQVELLFQVPFVEVALDISEALEATHNLVSGRLKYGEQLEVRLSRENPQQQYASDFSGCGIRPDWMNDHYIFFQSELLTTSCSVTMVASPLPESNADRLGISDPVLKECIDRGRNEYLEYSSQLACLNYRVQTSLEGIEKLTSLTSLALRGIALTEEGSVRIGQLVDLTGLLLDMGTFYEDRETLDLDLSRLVNLGQLQLANLPQGRLTLPDTSVLKSLSVVGSNTTELALSGLPNLENLSISGSDLTTLDLSNNKRLTRLAATDSALRSISGVTPEHQLESMELQQTPIKTLDLTGYDRLRWLDLSDSHLQEIDISPAVEIKSFTASGSQLQNMLFATRSNVQEVSITDTPLTELNIDMMPKLKALNIRRNNLLFLDFSMHTTNINVYADTGTVKSLLLPDNSDISYSSFSFRNNAMERLTVPASLKNSYLDFDNNQISQLNVLGSPHSLSAQSNLLESISISADSEVWELNLANNKLTSAQLSGTFENVDLSHNQLTSFYLVQDAINGSLNLANNLLTDFTVEGEISSSINVSHNALEHLDLPKYNGFHDKLDVSHNPLKSINFNGGELSYLYLSDTDLTELDVSSFEVLSRVSIRRTKIASIDIPGMVREFWADEVPATSFTIPANSRVTSISFAKNVLNSVVGLDNLTQRISIYVDNTVIDEALIAELEAHPYVYLRGL